LSHDSSCDKYGSQRKIKERKEKRKEKQENRAQTEERREFP
jgi:hypothetical protein